MASFLKILLRNVISGPSTDPFPFGDTFSPERIRGRVRIDPDKCLGCGMCRHSCVAGAINLQKNPDKGWTITVWQDSCCLCGSCRTYCPMHAITIDNDWHSAHVEADKFKRIEQHTIAYQPCPHCGAPVRVMSLEWAKKLYANDPSVDPEVIRHLCRNCRQVLDAEIHAACSIIAPAGVKKPALKPVETPAAAKTNA